MGTNMTSSSGPCGTKSCPHNTTAGGDSCCSIYSHYFADIDCPSFSRIDEVERLRAENAILRRMNRNLVRTGRDLANHNKLMREHLSLGLAR